MRRWSFLVGFAYRFVRHRSSGQTLVWGLAFCLAALAVIYGHNLIYSHFATKLFWGIR